MSVFVFSFAVTALAILGLATGVLLGRRPLRGSCGGNTVLQTCSLCGPREES